MKKAGEGNVQYGSVAQMEDTLYYMAQHAKYPQMAYELGNKL